LFGYTFLGIQSFFGPGTDLILLLIGFFFLFFWGNAVISNRMAIKFGTFVLQLAD